MLFTDWAGEPFYYSGLGWLLVTVTCAYASAEMRD